MNVLRDSLVGALEAPAVPDPPVRVWRDWALVGVFVPVAIVEAAVRTDVVWRPLALFFAIGAVLLLLYRRTHPVAVVLATFGTIVAVDIIRMLMGSAPGEFGLYTMGVVLLLPYALFRWASGRHAAIGSVFITASAVLSFLADGSSLGEGIAGLVIVFVPAELGVVVRQQVGGRERQMDEVRWREREQLARELHDTVAHHVSGIAVQAQAGQAVGGTNPDAALDALATIEEAASRTLIEMRNIVRALRSDDDAALAPQLGVADLDRLSSESAGPAPPVTVRLSGDLEDLPPATGSALYRLAQEAVTNAKRHAMNASLIDVHVVGTQSTVHLEVTDDGADPRPNPQPGYGLVGMSERAALLGGTFEAGPRDGRGWSVVATLPRIGPS